MNKILAINLTIFFSLGLFLYGFIFAKYHFKLTIFYGFLGFILAGIMLFFLAMAVIDDE